VISPLYQYLDDKSLVDFHHTVSKILFQTMPRDASTFTPTKSISPPARRTRSAVKKRQSQKAQQSDDAQERSAATPQAAVRENPPTPHLSSDSLETGGNDDHGIVIESAATRKVTRSSRKKVALPPLSPAAVPPPPSAQKTYSTRKRQKEVEVTDPRECSNDISDNKPSQTEVKEEKSVSLRSSTRKKRKDDSMSVQDAEDSASSIHPSPVTSKETPRKGASNQDAPLEQNEKFKSSIHLDSSHNEKTPRKRKKEVVSSTVEPELHSSSKSSSSDSKEVQSRKRKKDAPEGTEKDALSVSLKNESSQVKQKSEAKKAPSVGKTKNKTRENKTNTPQIAVNVHRFRNANYIPRGILRLCSTPYSPNNNHYPQLAISREGGAVELVSVNEKWKCVGIVEGMKNRNVDAMAWLCGFRNELGKDSQPILANESETQISSSGTYFSQAHKLAAQSQLQRRLFGASRDGTMFEIDFKTKRHKGVIGSGGGAVFCLVSLCPCFHDSKGSCSKLLAAGCEDGSVRIFRARENADVDALNHPCLELISTLPSVGSAVISIAWLPGSGASKIEGSIIYVGAADGTIRKFHCSVASKFQRLSGSTPHAISTGAVLHSDDVDIAEDTISSSMQWKAGLRITLENRGSRSATKVWAILALTDGTVVSGDSLGNVQFWDGNAGTLLFSFEHNPNSGDVFDLAVSYDQTKVMASGIDSKVICIERIPSSSCAQSKWVLTSQQRSHTHDVNSLALVYLSDSSGSLNGNMKCRELLCSAGLDTKVCSYFVANMRKHRAKVSYKYPAKAPICLSKGPRILSIMRQEKVDFYQLATVETEPVNGCNVSLDEEQAYLGSVGVASNFNLISFDVSEDGSFMAVSHSAGLMIFKLDIVNGTKEDGSSSTVVVPKKINVPSDLDVACSALKFGPDYLLCATVSGCINVIRIHNSSDNYELAMMVVFDQESLPKFESGKFPISEMSVSANGKLFATARNSLGKGSLQVFSLAEKQHWWTLPCTESPHSALKFLGDRSSMKPVLAVACNNGAFYLFDVERRCLTDWSEDLGFPAGPNLPTELVDCPNCPENLLYNFATPNKLVMVSFSENQTFSMAFITACMIYFMQVCHPCKIKSFFLSFEVVIDI
jgi:U3 small nucleolar RNA-associated protein 4